MILCGGQRAGWDSFPAEPGCPQTYEGAEFLPSELVYPGVELFRRLQLAEGQLCLMFALPSWTQASGPLKISPQLPRSGLTPSEE